MIEMLKNLTKVNAVEVPYKGGVLAVHDLLGGQINFIFSDTLPAMDSSSVTFPASSSPER